MSFAEAQYAIDEILDGLKSKQATGLEPNNVKAVVYFKSRDDGMRDLYIDVNLSDTVVDGETLCKIGKCKVLYKEGSPSKNETDGTLIYTVSGSGQKHIEVSSRTFAENGYVTFFPISDHNVVNRNPVNSYYLGVPKVYGFHQDFTDLNPDTAITYTGTGIKVINENWSPIYLPKMADSTTTLTAQPSADFEYNEWENWDWLKKNIPCAIDYNGEKVFELNHSDFTKKADGTASELSNSASVNTFNGHGAFSWIPKIYIKEVYSPDTVSYRDVYFTDDPTIAAADSEFYPLGFVFNNEETEGVWIPISLPISGNESSSVTTKRIKYMLVNNAISSSPVTGMFDFDSNVVSVERRTAAYGGPLENLIRDLVYMLFKSSSLTNIFGFGVPKRYSSTYSELEPIIWNTDTDGYTGAMGQFAGDKKPITSYLATNASKWGRRLLFYSWAIIYQAYSRVNPYIQRIQSGIFFEADAAYAKVTEMGDTFTINSKFTTGQNSTTVVKYPSQLALAKIVKDDQSYGYKGIKYFGSFPLINGGGNWSDRNYGIQTEVDYGPYDSSLTNIHFVAVESAQTFYPNSASISRDKRSYIYDMITRASNLSWDIKNVVPIMIVYPQPGYTPY